MMKASKAAIAITKKIEEIHGDLWETEILQIVELIDKEIAPLVDLARVSEHLDHCEILQDFTPQSV